MLLRQRSSSFDAVDMTDILVAGNAGVVAVDFDEYNARNASSFIFIRTNFRTDYAVIVIGCEDV